MLNNLSQVGNPDPNNCTFIRFDFITTGNAVPNCHIDNILIPSKKGKGFLKRINYDTTDDSYVHIPDTKEKMDLDLIQMYPYIIN